MVSDNPSGAGNQQERLGSADWLERIPTELGHYIAGFVDGEGSFNAPIRRARDGRFEWRAGVSFNVSQVGAELPELLHRTFEVGTVRGRQDGVYYYEVTRPRDLESHVFPFFERFPLRLKQRDLAVLGEITALIQAGLHNTPQGIDRILTLRAPMNRGGKRRRTDQEIRAALWN